jgi:hypothetical protein
VLDAQGKIAWGRADIGGDPIVVVLTERVFDAHLAGLRKDAVSYIFAGEREPDLGRALDILNEELGIKRLELGAKGASCVFDSRYEESGMPAPLRSMMLESSEGPRTRLRSCGWVFWESRSVRSWRRRMCSGHCTPPRGR